ncbi:hypothetical protein N7988_12715 [Bacillus cereus]|uniref:Uncharacterized protein n=1 Tax=Bacillus thuringiensis serovar yosoo TaxID=180848 RepID=A0A9X6F2P7_BACTU|nr:MULTISPECIES: hypothetical protein [Bacillus cereus group]MCU7753517.1 hypothetical protein [Bacillus cereus]MDC7750032.1 hypothetical protein [Bacillus cereus]MDZ4552720.1 hypothetical protein [Bacillus cereus]OTY52343.1 hypothetical protein BK746_29515 [Bacillus thuringiensis serovar yosoo]UXP16745.1 hypothetical protein N7988_12715 [Bacillus cereus]
MNEENIVLHGVAVESSLIDSTLLSILRHSLYQQEQQEQQVQQYYLGNGLPYIYIKSFLK